MSRPAAGRQIVICGLGGQGILFLSRVLAGAAMLDGDEVLTAETHGMSQRGGAVEAHLKLGDFHSSLVRRGSADAVLVLDPTRVEAGVPFLGPDGTCFANAPGPTGDVKSVDATGEARARGLARGQNLVLLGYAAGTSPHLFPSRDALLQSMERLSPEAAWGENRQAFGRGGELANGA
ncbi:MAG: 2-oxoacid:acceptor oxidoreductase family protein [Planctomycetota bacterium]